MGRLLGSVRHAIHFSKVQQRVSMRDREREGRDGVGRISQKMMLALEALGLFGCGFGSTVRSINAGEKTTRQQLITMINGFPDREILTDGVYKAVLRYSELLRLSTPDVTSHHITSQDDDCIRSLFTRAGSLRFIPFFVCGQAVFAFLLYAASISSLLYTFLSFFCSPLRGTLACFYSSAIFPSRCGDSDPKTRQSVPGTACWLPLFSQLSPTSKRGVTIDQSIRALVSYR
ncbi:hypothetical protein BDD12DRAFT_23120 [Trichophaea hybrida]|nr:hypothetical protein BDD12DRAFT_23120 [Trichophaea hybrida]